MGFIQKTRKKLSQILGSDLSNSDISEVNAILKRPEIQRIRQGVGPKIMGATEQVVENYVKSKRKKSNQSNY